MAANTFKLGQSKRQSLDEWILSHNKLSYTSTGLKVGMVDNGRNLLLMINKMSAEPQSNMYTVNRKIAVLELFSYMGNPRDLIANRLIEMRKELKQYVS